jgi:hypothetical protein
MTCGAAGAHGWHGIHVPAQRKNLQATGIAFTAH